MDQNNKVLARFSKTASELFLSRNAHGYWDGQLSSSALGVAVSVIAFHFYDAQKLHNEIKKGITWLMMHNNIDGGFGDSPESLSNISTSLLCYSALFVTRESIPESKHIRQLLSDYLEKSGIKVESKDLAKHILKFYKNDYTFSVPILTTCALCGFPGKEAFDLIPQLPFEFALLPRNFYRLLNLNVVSYAIPALIAVGIAIFQNKHSGRLMKAIRKRSTPLAIRLLEKIMPQSGGFLEAIPLTAFVSLSLIQSGYGYHHVVKKGINFLKSTQREDGSWPIDINLSIWVTTLAIKSYREKLDSWFDKEAKQKLTIHLLSNQYDIVHPFNGSGAGGWGWTTFSGSVPDGDDTPGSILALLYLNPNPQNQVIKSVIAGCDWLLKLQNRDGGFPTFSKGWGKLPFDQSCADLTGHAILALTTTIGKLEKNLSPVKQKKYRHAVHKALRYLIKNQLDNGAWLPLWFGNQFQSLQKNPVYGTARVTAYLIDIQQCNWISDSLTVLIEQCLAKAQNFLISVQNVDGSWGGDSGIEGSIEETALAISALSKNTRAVKNCQKGLRWLEQHKFPLKAAPIGLYFASLWYDEKLYPLVMYNEALARTIEINKG